MAYEDILDARELLVGRRATTLITRRAVASWSDRGWLSFEASTDLNSMNPNLARLRDLLATVIPLQNGFGAFDVAKFDLAWKALFQKGTSVQVAYDAVWAGFQ